MNIENQYNKVVEQNRSLQQDLRNAETKLLKIKKVCECSHDIMTIKREVREILAERI